jgi:DNA-binding CsgD family transcriptional regulator
VNQTGATGKEVAGRVLLSVLGQVSAAGHDPERLVEGLPFGLDDLRRPGFRIDWGDFSTVWRKVGTLLGGEPGMEQMAVEIVRASFVLRVLGRVFLTPRQLYLSFVPRMGRALYTNVRSAMVGLDGDRVVWESRTSPGYAFPPFFGAATRGLLRAYTRLLDLPEARVDGTSSETSMRYVVTLPPPRTFAAAWTRLAAPAPERPPDVDDRFDVAEPEGIAELLGSRSAPPEQVHALGASLPSARSLDALALALFDLLEHHFVVHTASLWTVGDGGRLALAGTTGGAQVSVLHSRDLVVGGRHVGRLDVDGAALHPRAATYDEFEALLPWVAMAVARLLDGPPDADAAVADAARAASLTSREAEVLRWVREGKTDREIAAILGISHRTVQKHVERMLAKMGVESRLAAARRTFDLT